MLRTCAPDPGAPFRPDSHWEKTVDGGHWTVAEFGGLRCCEKIGGPYGWVCNKQAVAVTFAGSPGEKAWCREHIDGRWVQGGHVWYWRLVDDEQADATAECASASQTA